MDGAPLRAPAQLERIRRLAIPPAYTRVWICPLANGHLQATGRDARGRKQYRYHAQWRVARDCGKFGRMLEFGRSLPRIRARVARDLRQPVGRHPHRDAVLAALVRLLDTTLIRVGNEEYTRANGSYGLTTLRNRHAQVSGNRLQLHFRGKSGVIRHLALADPRVARVVRACRELPGQELFQFAGGDGRLHGIGSADVNDYLREASGAGFTAKDFRTWHASTQALALLCRPGAGPGAARSATAGKRQANGVLAEVAKRLGNTVAVCRKSYVHPILLDLALADRLRTLIESARAVPRRGLTHEEQRMVLFLGAI